MGEFWTVDNWRGMPLSGHLPPLVVLAYRDAPAWVSLDSMKFRNTAQGGFTLLELMIVVGIGAILAVIALPSLQGTLYNTRQSSALGLLVNDLNQARGEAIKRNERVLLCGRNADGTNCSGAIDWQAGWVVCVESNVVNVCAADSVVPPITNVLVVRPPLNANLTLAASDVSIRFNANSSAGAAGQLTLDGTWSGAATRTLNIAVTGNISKQ